MVRQVGAPLFDRRGMMKKGVIVRHLVLPGCVSDSKDVLEYLWDTFGNQIYVSIMSQYTPLPHVAAYPEINRKVTDEEYEEIVDYARFLGMDQVYIQEGEEELRRLASGDYAVIYITEALAAQIPHEIARYREQVLPAIIQIPGVSGNTGAGITGVKKSVEQAVGSDILFGND